MPLPSFARWGGWLLLLGLLPGTAAAQESWGEWLYRQVEQHPDVLAAKQAMQAQLTGFEAGRQPIYNPSIEAAVEKEGREDNVALGLSQTVDFWGKRAARTAKIPAQQQAARSAYQAVLRARLAEAVQAWVRWQTARAVWENAAQQERQLLAIIDQLERRQESGDIGRVDVALGYLALPQRLQSSAEAQADLQQARVHVQSFLPQGIEQTQDVPQDLWRVPDWPDLETVLMEHPEVQAARDRWLAAQQEAQYARLETREDPTVGINVGRMAQESVFGLSVSIPWEARSDFRHQIQAAAEQAGAEEAAFRARYRRQLAVVQGSLAALKAYDSRYRRWQTLREGRLQEAEPLLKQQWDSGEITTAQYLSALAQSAEGRQAGIELERQWRLAVVTVLADAGQLLPALQTP